MATALKKSVWYAQHHLALESILRIPMINKNVKQMFSEEKSKTNIISDNVIQMLTDAAEYGTFPSENLEILQRRISEMKKGEAVLKQHNHKVWQGEDKVWYTYIDDQDSARGYRRVKRKHKKELVDALVQHYTLKLQTVKHMKDKWIEFKRENTRVKEQTLTKYENEYKRFFAGTEFEKMPIAEIKESDIRDFIVWNIKEKDLTAKAFAGLRTLLNGIFKHAKQEEKTSISISTFFADLDLNSMYRPPAQRTEAYSEFEIRKIIKGCEEKGDAISLGVVLDFQMGARIGETAVCRWEDVSFKHATIHIHGTEVCYKDPKTGQRIRCIQDSPKTEAGNRIILLTDAAVNTLHKLYELTGHNEFICSDPKDGHRYQTGRLRKRLKDVCEKVGVKYRATHSARRTMGTTLLNSGLPDDLVRKQMGHTDIETTRKYYNRDRTDPETARKRINEIVNY